MLGRMKQKLSGNRKPAVGSSSKEETPSASANHHRGNTPSTAARPTSTAAAARPSSATRGKPPLPQLNAETSARYYAEVLPSFKDVPSDEKQVLFVRKLHLCAFTFDFTDPSKNSREKEIKRQTLCELVDYVTTGQGKFTEVVSEDIIFMLRANLFRTLPPPRSQELDSFDPEEEEPQLEVSWPHLQIVYEFLLRYVVSNDTDAKVAKKYVDQSFVLKLLDLFDSEDPRERDYLKTILHRVYGKFMAYRPFIRRAINNVFYRFIFETERHNGIAELLEILGSIINGFALPLKDEHKVFLHRALMLLHKPKCVSMYHQQLAYCVIQFVEKDPRLADSVIRALLRYWPVTNSAKEVLFLGELEEILELTQPQEFQKVVTTLFRQIAKCLRSSHFQVAERALFLWNNEWVVRRVAEYRSLILPIVFPALHENANNHWNSAVHGLTLNVQKVFQDMDENLWAETAKSFKEAQEAKEKLAAQREDQWRAIEAAASRNQSEPQQPQGATAAAAVR